MNDVRVVAAGDAALVAEFDDRIDPAVNARAIALAQALRNASLPGVRDIVPAYRAVTVYFDPLRADAADLEVRMRAAASTEPDARGIVGPIVHVPVCYDAEFGPDLETVARFAGLTPRDVVDLHRSREYRVFMLGFVPGFAYMGTVDPRIGLPRRTDPRTAVPAGSVAVAGGQTGIYPSQTPGGWHIIGRTPMRLVSFDAPVPSKFAAGDRVRFHQVDRAAFERIAGLQEFMP
ncbi:MAG: 5-oxoprolinase subunit PxpB [Vicinamibacterales bacterium]